MTAYVSTRDLHYQKVGKSFFAFITDLPKKQIPLMQVYPDASDNGFWLVSHKTGAEIKMVLSETKIINGDTMGWKYIPVDKNAPINSVLIIND